MPELSPITHVIFDFDGVILDSERVFSEANHRALQKYGKSYTNEMKLGMMGRTQVEGAKWVLESVGLTGMVSEDSYLEEYREHLEILIKQADVLPGIRNIINHFEAHDIPMAICTSSDIEEFNSKISKCSDILSKMEHVVTVGSDDEILRGKPAPDPYLAAMRRFRDTPTSPKNVLVFEDSVSGVLSASSAGTTTIMVPQLELLPKSWIEVEKSLVQQVDDIIYSIEHFVPEKYGLPTLKIFDSY